MLRPSAQGTLCENKRRKTRTEPSQQKKARAPVYACMLKTNCYQVEPLPADVFKKDQTQLARDLMLKEAQIEYLISLLPGLDRREMDQEEKIRQLEEELKAAEIQRKEALKEKEAALARLDSVIVSVKRP
jgi:hypothetical protein